MDCIGGGSRSCIWYWPVLRKLGSTSPVTHLRKRFASSLRDFNTAAYNPLSEMMFIS
jgi:hypothetical protein